MLGREPSSQGNPDILMAAGSNPHFWEVLLVSFLPLSSRWFLLLLGLQLPQPPLVYSDGDLLKEQQLLLHHGVAKKAKHDMVTSQLVPQIGRRRLDLARRMVSGPSPALFRYKTDGGPLPYMLPVWLPCQWRSLVRVEGLGRTLALT